VAGLPGNGEAPTFAHTRKETGVIAGFYIDDFVVDSPTKGRAEELLRRWGCMVDAGTVKFPQGTIVDKIETPEIGACREQRIISLPNGVKLVVQNLYPCVRPGCTHNRMLLPGTREYQVVMQEVAARPS
jgi:hypothetical protein